MKSFAATDIGRVRKLNEDMYYNDPEKMGLYIIADGMGGHQAGEVASALAVDTLSGYVRDHLQGSGLGASEIENLLRDALVRTNETVYSLATSQPGYAGMGTTVVACIVREGHAHIAHIGDSRAYLIREREMKQLTTDHSFVQELLSKGRITEAEAADHPRKNILTRALGTDPAVEIDTVSLDLRRGDSLMLCTDGISNHVHTQELLNLIADNPPDRACTEIIGLANSRGGFDNMTILIVENTPVQEGRQ